jgi:hypothetical protein
MDEFHESGGVASISGVEGEEWAVPGLLGSRVDCKRMTLFFGLIPIQVKNKTKWNGPFQASFRAKRTSPKAGWIPGNLDPRRSVHEQERTALHRRANTQE